MPKKGIFTLSLGAKFYARTEVETPKPLGTKGDITAIGGALGDTSKFSIPQLFIFWVKYKSSEKISEHKRHRIKIRPYLVQILHIFSSRRKKSPIDATLLQDKVNINANVIASK